MSVKISPQSDSGNQLISTLIYYETCFYDAVSFKEITSFVMAEALLSIFSRVSVPHKIFSYSCAKLTTDLMSEIHKFIDFRFIFTTPCHPMIIGKLERQHSTFKSVLWKFCES